MNSSELLTVITTLSGNRHSPAPDIDIELLHQQTGQKITALVSMLTELEQRDKLKLNLSPDIADTGEIAYSGTVRLAYEPEMPDTATEDAA